MLKRIILRCDYFKGSGIGHIKRSSILASCLKKKGFKPILLIDENLSENKILIDVEVQAIGLKNFNELNDAEYLIGFAKSNNSNIIICDSYRITNRWVSRIQKEGMKVILLEDSDSDSIANLIINYTPSKNINSFSLKKNLLKGPKFFITDSKLSKSKEIYPKRIIAHAGGNGDYSRAKNIYKTLALISDKRSIKVDWICPNSVSKNSLKSILNLNQNDKIIDWQRDSSSLWSEYQIVVGPASTSVYEAIIQGSLPISFSISKTQSTQLKDWLTIGHSLHISDNEKENPKFINSIFKLAIANYKNLLMILEDASCDIDCNGVQRVVKAIEYMINSSNKHYDKLENKYLRKGVSKCTISDAESFLQARNSKEVREISTDPNHIIDWPEHLKWWMNSKTDKYLFVGNSNKPEVYFWIKKWHIHKQNYLTAGWFPANNKTPFSSVLKILDWQIKYYSEKYKGYIWVATVKNNNKAAITINKRLGFVNASSKIYKALPILFPGTNHQFTILEKEI